MIIIGNYGNDKIDKSKINKNSKNDNNNLFCGLEYPCIKHELRTRTEYRREKLPPPRILKIIISEKKNIN